MPVLRLLTFGGLSLVDDGVPVTGAASQRSRLALLALLAAAGPAGMAREKVLACLWPESEDERARHALKQAVYALRRDLGSEHAISGTATLCLDPTLITSDIREFEEALARSDDAAAVAVYAGPFLDGVFVKGSAEFDQWAGVERSRLERAHLDAVARLARGAEKDGDMVAAVQWWRRAAAAEPVSGRVALSLMRALAESGDVSAAIQHARLHDAMVQAELESPADDAVLAFAEELRKGEWTPTARVSREAPAVRESPAAGTPASLPVTDDVASPPAILPPAAPVTATVPPRKRSPLMVAGIGLLAMIGVAVLGALARDRVTSIIGPTPAPLSTRRIVVSVLKNNTGDARQNIAGEMAADHIVKQLNAAGFEVVDMSTTSVASSVVDTLVKSNGAFDGAAALAKETGAVMVVGGKYYLQGDSLLFDANVIDPVRKLTLFAVDPVGGRATEVSDIVSRLARQVAVKLIANSDTTPGSSTTALIPAPSVEAYAHARQGWGMFFLHPADTAAAFAELARAVSFDTTYTTPRLMRAYILDVKERWADLAVAVDELGPRRKRMGRVELAALALFEADLRGDLEGRLRASRELLRLSPANADFALLLAISASYLNKSDEVLAVLAASNPDLGINPLTPMYWAWQAEAEHTLGRFDDEERSARRMIARFPSQLYGFQALTRSLAARGDTAGLYAQIRRPGWSGARITPDARTLALLGARELRAHGRKDAAMALFARVAAMKPAPDATVDDRGKHALALYEAGDYAGARAAYAALLAASPRDLDVIGRLGAIAARTGDSASVRATEARLAKWDEPYALGRPTYWRAHLAALTGRGSEAISLLHTAIEQEGFRAMDLNIITLHEEPDFMSIWSDPGFHDLVKPSKTSQAARDSR